MRKYFRRMARYCMQRQGIVHINRKHSHNGKKSSYFSTYWKKVVKYPVRKRKPA